MDETGVTFDLPSNRTVNFKEASSNLVKTTGQERISYIIMLSWLANETSSHLW